MSFHFSDSAFIQVFQGYGEHNTCQYEYDDEYCDNESIDIAIPCCQEHRDEFLYELSEWQSNIMNELNDDDRENLQQNFPSLEINLFVYQYLVPKRNNLDFDKIAKLPEISKECPVCFGDNEILVLPCHHPVCYSCYNKIEDGRCAICRVNIDFNLVKRL